MGKLSLVEPIFFFLVLIRRVVQTDKRYSLDFTDFLTALNLKNLLEMADDSFIKGAHII